MKQGKVDLARKSLETAQRLGDDSFAPAQMLATLDLEQKLGASAIARLSVLPSDRLSAAERTVRAHLLLAASSLEKTAGDSVSAFEAATRALATEELRADLQVLGQTLAASAALEQSMKLEEQSADPELVKEWLNRGFAQLGADETTSSVEPALLAPRLDVSGRLRQRLGQGERACRDFESAFDTLPSPARAKRSVSCYSRLEKWAAARATAQKVLERLSAMAPDSTPSVSAVVLEIRAQLARALHHLGQYDAAITSYRLAGLDEEASSLEQALTARRTQEAHEARCSDLRDKGQRRLDETAWAKGTPEWKLIEIEVRKSLEGCDGYAIARR